MPYSKSHVNARSSCDYDIQQLHPEIDIAAITGMDVLENTATHQSFPARAVPRHKAPRWGLRVCVNPRPRVLTPRCRLMPQEREPRVHYTALHYTTRNSHSVCIAGAASQDAHRLTLRYASPLRSGPTAMLRPCLRLPGCQVAKHEVEVSNARYVKPRSSTSPGRFCGHFGQIHYNRVHCTVRPAWGYGPLFTCRARGCIGRRNRHATSEPWLGKCCLGRCAIRNLVSRYAQHAQRLLQTLADQQHQDYRIGWHSPSRKPRQYDTQSKKALSPQPLNRSKRELRHRRPH